jgi:hypothetical protein
VQIFGHDLFSGSPNPVSLFRDSFFVLVLLDSVTLICVVVYSMPNG